MDSINLNTAAINQSKNIRKSAWLDLVMVLFLIGSLMIVLTVMPHQNYNFFNLSLLILILIPTIKALVKGAPFVPTPLIRVQKMLEVAKVKPGEKVYDIGCGDGRMVYIAARDYGANAVGLELSPLVYALARIRKFFWRSKAKVLFRDFNFCNLSDADVIVCYLLPDTLARLQVKFDKELKKGTRVISYAFKIGNWKEVRSEARDRENSLAPIWIYEVK